MNNKLDPKKYSLIDEDYGFKIEYLIDGDLNFSQEQPHLGTLLLNNYGIVVSFRDINSKINISKDIIQQISYSEEFSEIIIILKNGSFVNIYGNNKSGYIRTGIFLEENHARILIDKIISVIYLNDMSNNISKSNDSIPKEVCDDVSEEPSKYRFFKLNNGYKVEGRNIPSGDFGRVIRIPPELLITILWLGIIILLIISLPSLSKNIVDMDSRLLINLCVFVPCLVIWLTFILANPYLFNINMKRMIANDEGLTVEFVEAKEPIFIPKNNISEFFVKQIEIMSSRENALYRYRLYLMTNNPVQLGKNYSLYEIFTGLTFRDSTTAEYVKDKFNDVFRLS